MSDPIDLDKLQTLADAATPGPWKLWAMTVLADPVGNSNLDDGLTIAETYDPHRGLRTFNGEFICAAREAIPALIAEVREVRSPDKLVVDRAWLAGISDDLHNGCWGDAQATLDAFFSRLMKQEREATLEPGGT